MSEPRAVIVVGGGPAGASSAWHLARAGAAVTLLDRARFPREKPCAEYLSPQASRILEAMGVIGACERAGAARLAGMSVRSPSGERALGTFAACGVAGARDHGLALRRTVLDAIVLQAARAAGVRVVEGAHVIDLLRDHRGAVAGVRVLDQEGRAHDHRAALVVGADGLRSIVARRLGVTRFARVPRRLAFVAHYAGVRGMAAHGEMHVERDGYVGLASVDNGLTNVAVVVPAACARGASGRAAEFFDAWLAARPQLAPRLREARRVSDVRVTGPFAQRARRSWHPGAALVGDAADFFDPFTGEGIYAALRGGELLAPFALAAIAAPTPREADTALAAYHRARHREFAGKWLVERLVGLAVGSPAIMDRVVRALRASPPLAHILVGVTGDILSPQAVLSPGFVARLAAAALRAPSPALPPLSPIP